MASDDPEIDGNEVGKLPFGNKIPDQPTDNEAAATVLLVLMKPTVRAMSEKFKLPLELTEIISVRGGDEAGVYVV